MLDPSTWSRENIERHSLDMRQFIDFRQSTLPNGMRVIEAYNSSGLTFTILPDRGLDIWTAHYNGIPLTWISQGSPYPPDFGQTWVQQFNGGLLTTCGLMHVGGPETDDSTGEVRDDHGRFSRLRAYDISVSRDWPERVQLTASVVESSLFGPQLKLERTYSMDLGQPIVTISDTVTNVGDEPMPFMLLYHFNFGYPFIAEATKLHVDSHKVYPRDPAAREGYGDWSNYHDATPRYPEQVFFHHVKAENEFAEVALLRKEFGVNLMWDHRDLPYLTQWKNTRQGIYVCGVEPGNCIPEGQNAARKAGRLVILEPGEIKFFFCSIGILPNARKIKRWQQDYIQVMTRATPVIGCQLDDYAPQIP
jgi:hypothetical protein